MEWKLVTLSCMLLIIAATCEVYAICHLPKTADSYVFWVGQLVAYFVITVAADVLLGMSIKRRENH